VSLKTKCERPGRQVSMPITHKANPYSHMRDFLHCQTIPNCLNLYMIIYVWYITTRYEPSHLPLCCEPQRGPGRPVGGPNTAAAGDHSPLRPAAPPAVGRIAPMQGRLGRPTAWLLRRWCCLRAPPRVGQPALCRGSRRGWPRPAGGQRRRTLGRRWGAPRHLCKIGRWGPGRVGMVYEG
jgi:hypothetical protein